MKPLTIVSGTHQLNRHESPIWRVSIQSWLHQFETSRPAGPAARPVAQPSGLPNLWPAEGAVGWAMFGSPDS